MRLKRKQNLYPWQRLILLRRLDNRYSLYFKSIGSFNSIWLCSNDENRLQAACSAEQQQTARSSQTKLSSLRRDWKIKTKTRDFLTVLPDVYNSGLLGTVFHWLKNWIIFFRLLKCRLILNILFYSYYHSQNITTVFCISNKLTILISKIILRIIFYSKYFPKFWNPR